MHSTVHSTLCCRHPKLHPSPQGLGDQGLQKLSPLCQEFFQRVSQVDLLVQRQISSRTTHQTQTSQRWHGRLEAAKLRSCMHSPP